MSKKDEDHNVIKGSDDFFADLGFEDAPLMRLKSRVATEIVRALDRRGLSVRVASKEAGAPAADLSRIRSADLDRFSLDRLVRIAKRLGCRIDLREEEIKEKQPKLRAVAQRPRTFDALQVSASALNIWANEQIAQSQFPRLVRRLMHGAATISAIAVPTRESTVLPGWDGQVTSIGTNAWLPEGNSFWEMSCRADIAAKANEDYEKRLQTADPSVRSQSTFIFATPRRWPGKSIWIASKQAKGEWVDVRAYDADDLEHWLEQSPAVALQFAEELGLAGPGVESASKYWSKWAGRTVEEITTAAFLNGREKIKRDLLQRLHATNEDGGVTLTLQADSVDEAVAFAVSCVLEEEQLRNRAVVVSAAQGWRFVEANPSIAIAVVARPELAEHPVRRDGLRVVIPFAAGDVTGHFRGAATLSDRADFVLERPNFQNFEKSLTQLGIDHGDAERLARMTGRSWSVFLRQRSRNPALHEPPWLASPHAWALSTVCLVGAWTDENIVDKAIVAKIAGRPYEELERDLRALSVLEDAPVVCIGRVWKAKAPVELLVLFGPQLTTAQLDCFFEVLHSILVGRDPELDVPQENRYAASMYGKTRPQSGLVIRSLCDTLIKLSVRGSDFPSLQHLNLEQRADAFVRAIIGSADVDRWLSLRLFLRPLAEAAPREFLRAIEVSLDRSEQPVGALLRETSSSGVFGGGCYFADLLWALEILAWAPERLARVAIILARLSHIEIKGNWGNKPESSLLSLFKSWIPQTAATVERRVEALDKMIEREENIGFEILDRLVNFGPDVGTSNARPLWRDDDAGSGRGTTELERHKMVVEAAERMFRLAAGKPKRIAALITKMAIFDSPRITKVMGLCRAYTQPDANDADRAIIRAALRSHIHQARNYGRLKGAALESHLRTVESMYAKLEPRKLFDRYSWLFESDWPDTPIRVREEKYEDRAKLLEQLRSDAVREIFLTQGLSAIAELARATDGYFVGISLAKLSIPTTQLADWVLTVDSDFEFSDWMSRLSAGLLRALREQDAIPLLQEVSARVSLAGWSLDKLARFFASGPERRSTWDIVLALGQEIDAAYWSVTRPGFWIREDSADFEFALKRLISAGRPLSALSMAHLAIEKVDPLLIVELLEGVLTGQEPDGPRIDSWHIQKALAVLEESPAIDRIRLMRLEFGLIQALGYNGEHKAKTLYERLMSEPQIFTELLTLLYKPESRDRDEPIAEGNKVAAELAWRVLHACRRQPGTRIDGTVDPQKFASFVDDARRLCKDVDRLTMCDHTLGQIMAYAPAGTDGIWPFDPARAVLDKPEHEEIRRGFIIGTLNKRGVHSRSLDEGGVQERDLAERFRRHAQALYNSHVLLADTIEMIARSYENDAIREDARARLQREGEY